MNGVLPRNRKGIIFQTIAADRFPEENIRKMILLYIKASVNYKNFSYCKNMISSDVKISMTSYVLSSLSSLIVERT